MVDTLKLYNDLKKDLDQKAALKIAEVIGDLYGELQKTVTREEFTELTQIVKRLAVAQERIADAQEITEVRLKELAEVQKRTEERLEQLTVRVDKLTIRVDELAQAQKRTEERLEQLTVRVDELAIRVDELAQAQKRTEERLEQLTVRVDELAEAQKRTEERLEQLTVRVDELAEAQKQTEFKLQRLTEEVRKLNADHAETRRQLGGITATIGYTLENESYKALPRLLQEDYGIIVQGRLDRDYIVDNQGKEIEINILGKAHQNGNELLIVGESKSQLSRNDVDKFIRKKLKRLEGIHEHLFPIIVTHMITSRDVAEYAKKKGIVVYKSSHF